MHGILAAIDFSSSAQLVTVVAMLVIGGAILAGRFILWFLGIE